MARFVMANRRAHHSTTAAQQHSLEALGNALAGNFMTGAQILAQNTPATPAVRHVVIFEAERKRD